jgi:hypothetical protein
LAVRPAGGLVIKRTGRLNLSRLGSGWRNFLKAVVAAVLLAGYPAAMALEFSVVPARPAPLKNVTANPAITAVMPSNLIQGQHYTLTLSGHDLNSRVRFFMGEGIEVGVPMVIGTSTARVDVNVHAGAPLGLHPITLIMGNQRFTGPAGVIVSAAGQAPVGVQGVTVPSTNPFAPPAPGSSGLPPLAPPVAPLAPPVAALNISQVTPGQWVTGQKYPVTFAGQGFVPGMEVNLGSGVKLLTAGQKPQVLSPYLARAEIEVAGDAVPGLRQISLRTGPQQSWRIATAKAWVMPLTQTYSGSAGGAFPRPKFLPISQKMAIKKGVIELKAPGWKLGSGEVDKDQVSLLDDDVVFKWQEKNPGTANYFELRVMSMSGQVLLTKRIEIKWQGMYLPPPTYYQPDAAFLNALLNPQQGPGKAGTAKAKTVSAKVKSTGQGQGASSSTQYPAGSDLLWEVAGYRVYSSDGVSPGSKTAMAGSVRLAAATGIGAKTMTDVSSAGSSQDIAANRGLQVQAKPEPVEVEVEISDRWPLKRPNRPNGFGSCPLDGNNSGLSLFNRDRGAGGTEVNAVSYIGDTLQLTGSVDLSMSPYASHPQETQYASSTPSSQSSGQGGSMPFIDNEIDKQVTDHRFNNLFVDWGDGVVVPMTFKAGGEGSDHGASFNRGEILGLPSAQAYTEAQKPGAGSPYPQFFTHVYGDTDQHTIRVYQLSDGDVQHVNPSELDDAYSAGQGGVSLYSRLRQGTGQGGNSAKEIAGRAYVLYCHDVQMEPYKDPVAYGPLQLQSVAIVGFGAPKASSGGAVKLSAKKGQAAVNAGVTKTRSAVATSSQNQIQSNAQDKIGVSSAIKAVSDVDAVCSGCNKAFTAHAVLEYLGDKGTIKTVWMVRMKGTHPGRSSVQSFPGVGGSDVPRSPAREGDPHHWGEPQPGHFDLYSPPLPVDPASVYEVWVEVGVGPEQADNSGFNAITSIRRGMAPGAMVELGGNSKQRVGILRPTKEVLRAAPPVVYVDKSSLSAAAKHLGQTTWGVSGKMAVERSSLVQGAGAILKMPPFFVSSEHKKYRVAAIDPNKPCQLAFAGQDGDRFSIYLDQQNLPQDGGGTYSGTGTLDLKLATGDGAAMAIPAAIDFQNWKVDLAGNVAGGTLLKRTLNQSVSVPGMAGRLMKLDGVAGQKMDATLDLVAGDSEFRKPGSNDPVRWQATAPLRASGDWIATASVDKAALGWTGFVLSGANNVTLDISNSEGSRPGTCGGGSGTGWVGVRLGAAQVKLNTLDLATVQVPVSDWGIAGGHLCGIVDRQNDPSLKNLVVEKGTVSFDRIHFQADSAGMSAFYSFSAHLPWLDTDLHGDSVPLLPGKTTFDFAGVKPAGNVARDFGPMHFDVPASSFRFGQDSSGWRAIADPSVAFKAEGKPFMSAPLPVPDMRFGMNGRAWFDADGAASRNIPLSGTASLGKTAFDLNSVTLTGGASGNDRLGVAFHGKLGLSQALPAADVQVDYLISGDQYAGSGPVNAPFTVKTVLPLGQPTTEVSINPVYSPAASETRYTGAVDLALFGGPPVKGEFLLGYQGSKDYWLTRVSIPLGSSGVSLVPPYINLYQIRGGLGYHMALDAFKDAGTLANAQPDMGQGSLLMVGMRVGSPDQFAYMLDGDFTVSPSTAGGRMDFHAWLLSAQHSGNGNFQGFFQFAGGNFDGRLWGHLGLLNDAVAFDLGDSAGNAAVDLHFGGGWYIYAGKNTGPRIKAKVLVSDTDSYLMLGSDVGLAVGGAQHMHLGVGSSSVASAYVDGYMDMGLQITPQPRVSGDFGAGAEAGVCVVGGCESMGVNAAVHAEALPVVVRAHATVEFPWPLPDVSFDVHM